MEIRIAQSALEDLQAIQEYYREEGVPHIGEDFVTAILKRCGMLQIHPDAGRIVPEFNMDHIRELIHAPFRLSTSDKLKRLCSYASGEVRDSLN